MKALVVVAHPDDELIWMGGYILRNRGWDWTIAAMCRKDDPDRKPKFDKVCKKLNAGRHYISDLDDENLERSVAEKEIEERLFNMLEKTDYDCIFTHGKNGEYGHLRHKEVHNAVRNFILSKKLKCEKLHCFDYYNHGKICVANRNAQFFLDLMPEELRMKKEIITKDYGFRAGGFEERCCRAEEAFTVQEFR